MDLIEYNKQHRVREHGTEDGSVKQVGKKIKKWEGVYHAYVNGKRLTRRRIIGECSKLTKTQARDEHREWIRRFNSQPVADTAKATVGQLADDYYLLRAGDWDLATRGSMRSLIDCIIKPGLGHRTLESVTADDLKQFVNSLSARKSKNRVGISQSYAQKSISLVRTLFDLAAERDLIRKNPARSVMVRLRIPKAILPTDKSVFPPEQLPALLAQLDVRDSLIVWLSMLGATRPGELFALKGGDVGPRWVFIQRALNRAGEFKTTKTAKPRMVALPPRVAGELHDWVRSNQVGPNDLVFTGTRNGKPVNRGWFLKHRLRKAARRAGIATVDVDFQMLRRSFATIANAVGFDVKSIQAQLGHARPDMTLTEYTQSVDSARLDLMTQLEGMLRGLVPMPFDIAAKLGTALLQ